MPTIEVDIRKHILETLKTEEPLCITEIFQTEFTKRKDSSSC